MSKLLTINKLSFGLMITIKRSNLEVTNVFLEKCHISKMICKYIVLLILMVLRQSIMQQKESLKGKKHGFKWPSTGSNFDFFFQI